MKVIATLIWFEENPNWLTASVSSLKKLGVDHLVAVDGAYFLYPGAQSKSGADQHEAITECCHSLDMGLTLHTPQDVWYHNEVEKRSFMFRAAELIAEPNVDWYYVVDADERVLKCPRDLKAVLSDTDLDAAHVTYWERPPSRKSEKAQEVARGFSWTLSEQPIRKLFRALPGLRVEGNHFTYRNDEKVLWSYHRADIEPALDLTEIKVEHRTFEREKARKLEQREFYRRRQLARAELSTCAMCKDPTASFIQVPSNLEVRPDGSIEHDMIEVCEEHLQTVIAENRAAIEKVGGDPDVLAEQGLAGVA